MRFTIPPLKHFLFGFAVMCGVLSTLSVINTIADTIRSHYYWDGNKPPIIVDWISGLLPYAQEHLMIGFPLIFALIGAIVFVLSRPTLKSIIHFKKYLAGWIFLFVGFSINTFLQLMFGNFLPSDIISEETDPGFVIHSYQLDEIFTIFLCAVFSWILAKSKSIKKQSNTDLYIGFLLIMINMYFGISEMALVIPIYFSIYALLMLATIWAYRKWIELQKGR